MGKIKKSIKRAGLSKTNKMGKSKRNIKKRYDGNVHITNMDYELLRDWQIVGNDLVFDLSGSTGWIENREFSYEMNDFGKLIVPNIQEEIKEYCEWCEIDCEQYDISRIDYVELWFDGGSRGEDWDVDFHIGMNAGDTINAQYYGGAVYIIVIYPDDKLEMYYEYPSWKLEVTDQFALDCDILESLEYGELYDEEEGAYYYASKKAKKPLIKRKKSLKKYYAKHYCAYCGGEVDLSMDPSYAYTSYCNHCDTPLEAWDMTTEVDYQSYIGQTVATFMYDIYPDSCIINYEGSDINIGIEYYTEGSNDYVDKLFYATIKGIEDVGNDYNSYFLEIDENSVNKSAIKSKKKSLIKRKGGSEMKKNNQKIYDIIEDLGWWYDDYGDYVEIGQYSNAGEDFSFTVDTNNLVEEIRDYAYYFDEEEHVKMWLNSGANGVPDVFILVEDAKDIKNMLEILANAVLYINKSKKLSKSKDKEVIMNISDINTMIKDRVKKQRGN